MCWLCDINVKDKHQVSNTNPGWVSTPVDTVIHKLLGAKNKRASANVDKSLYCFRERESRLLRHACTRLSRDNTRLLSVRWESYRIWEFSAYLKREESYPSLYISLMNWLKNALRREISYRWGLWITVSTGIYRGLTACLDSCLLVSNDTEVRLP